VLEADQTATCIPPDATEKKELEEVLKINIDENDPKLFSEHQCAFQDFECLAVALSRRFSKNKHALEQIHEFHQKFFRPKGPTDANVWLSLVDIQNVVDQISLWFNTSESPKRIKFLGFALFDFVINASGKLGYPLTPKEIVDSYVADRWEHAFIVANTDVGRGHGRHWCLMSFDASPEPAGSGVNFAIRFYNPVGNVAPTGSGMRYCSTNRESYLGGPSCFNITFSPFYRMVELTLRSQLGETAVNKFTTEDFTGVLQHSKDNANCGVAVCIFMILIAKGYSFEKIQAIKTDPRLLVRFKQLLFSE
jgi:hypothetical protein